MEELVTGKGRVHKLMLTNRRTCTSNGVSDVLSFDIHEIVLETDMGMLVMKGNDLHVNRLSLEKGVVDIDGRVDSLAYSDAGSFSPKGESLLSRLFK